MPASEIPELRVSSASPHSVNGSEFDCPEGCARCPLGWPADQVSRGSAPVILAATDYSNPTEGAQHANLGRNSMTPRPSRRGGLRPERSHPNANYPIGRASASGANPSRSPGLPAGRAVPTQVRSQPA